MAKKRARRAVIYTRISIDRDGTSEAPERQLEICRNRCAEQGWTIVAELEERDRSAFTRDTSRPEYEKMMSLVRSGEVDAVVAWTLDRVWRRVSVLAPALEEFRDQDVVLICPGSGIDTSTAAGAMTATIVGAIAQMESEANSQRRVAKNLVDAVGGKYVKGGHRAFGRNMDGTVVEGEAEAIREIARRVIDGATLGSQARWLNEQGLRTTTDRAWLGTGLGQMLRQPHLRGIRVHNGEEHRGNFEAILDEATGLRLIERLRDNPAPRKGRAHLLSGLARCGGCGGRMNLGQVAHPKGGDYPPFVRYQCRTTDAEHNCGKVSASENSLDELVRDKFFQQVRLLIISGELDPGTDHADAMRIDREAKLDEIESAKRSQSELVDARFVDRTVTAEDYERVFLTLQEEMDRAHADLARLDAAQSSPNRDWDWLHGDFEQMWDASSVLARRDLLKTFIDRVVVAPARQRGGNQFDPDRVEIIWQPGAVVPEWITDEDDAEMPFRYQPR